MVLIGSASASSIFLIALLLWAILLTAERFSELDTWCLTFLLFLPICLLLAWLYLDHIAILRTGSWVLSWAWRTVVCRWPSVHTFVQPNREGSQTIRNPFTYIRFSSRSPKVLCKYNILFDYSFKGPLSVIICHYLHSFHLYPEACTHWAMRMRCILLLLWLMSPPTWGPPVRKRRSSHRRRSKEAIPWRRWSGLTYHIVKSHGAQASER